MKKLILFVIIFLMSASTWGHCVVWDELLWGDARDVNRYHAAESFNPDLPPGYTLICSEWGRYSLKNPSGIFMAITWATAEEAIEYAERWAEPDETWKECR